MNYFDVTPAPKLDKSWKPIASAPEGEIVMTRTEHGVEQELVKRGAWWWIPFEGIYVYPSPTEWRWV